ncbi:MAG: hypothetical protein ACI90V_014471 [Bacillariaceae sp.]|jgi:hypothetical protein
MLMLATVKVIPYRQLMLAMVKVIPHRLVRQLMLATMKIKCLDFLKAK